LFNVNFLFILFKKGGDVNYFKDKQIFVKPNIVFWTDKVNFSKLGVITTSKIVE